MAANKDNKSTEKKTAAERRANEIRGTKEVATKLRNMRPIAQAEVVNEVVNRQVSRQMSDFADFLREQSVIGIGIGLVLGAQIKQVVDQIMNFFVNPVTALFLPGKVTLSEKTFTMHIGDRGAVIGWGAIVYSIFTFVLVALIIFALFKMFKLDKLTKKK